MKTWMITLPFLFAAGLATAADPAPAPKAAAPKAEAAAPKAEAAAAAKAEAAPAAEQAAPAQPAVAKRHKARHHKARHLPKGDLRQCLELKDNKAIIACSEKRPKK